MSHNQIVFGHEVLPLLVSLCESLQQSICVRWFDAQLRAVMRGCVVSLAYSSSRLWIHARLFSRALAAAVS